MCRYCEHGDFMEDTDGVKDAAYIENGHLNVRTYVSFNIRTLVSMPIEYCPKCGRKINADVQEEA